MIEVKGISKKYSSKPVVNDVSFCIKKEKLRHLLDLMGLGKVRFLG